MAKKPKQKPDDKEQSQRFVETAKKLEVEEKEISFTKAIDSIIQYAPGHIRNISNKKERASKK